MVHVERGLFSIPTLYRNWLRTIRKLPHNYLRQFYRLKVRDDLEGLRDTRSPSLQKRKHARISKELRKMNRGLQGDWRSFDHILDIAYGRKGKLKHELLEPFLSDSNSPAPPPISPQISTSRDPVIPPRLRVLLTSDISRTTRGLKPVGLDNPPTLPARADPSSEEARLFGVLSKRRKKNILRRFFREEVQKIYPPIGLDIRDGGSLEDTSLKGGVELLGLKLRKDIEAIVGPVWKPPPLTRRERRALDPNARHEESFSEPRHPSRWLRRRYQSLLGRLPILISTPGRKPSSARYTVERSKKALLDIYNTGGRLLPVAAPAQLAWHESTATRSTLAAKR